MDNKYLFRVYHMGNNGEIFSPFLSGDAKRFGKTEKAQGVRNDIGNEFGSLWHKGKIYPKNNRHFGFSAFGKVDPRYSVFSDDDFDFDNDELLEAVHNSITKYVPEEAHGQKTLEKYYADGEKDDFEFLTNHTYSPRERTNYLSKFSGKNDTAQHFTISPEFFNFDSDSVWDDLVYDIDTYDTFHRMHPGMPDEGDRVVLVTTPESKIISVDDMINNGYTQQRDFPSEIVTSELTPIREFSEYPKAAANYDKLRDKGASGPEAFAESFKIEPKQIASDEQLKNIYKDLCYCADGNRKRTSIIKGIKELGQ